MFKIQGAVQQQKNLFFGRFRDHFVALFIGEKTGFVGRRRRKGRIPTYARADGWAQVMHLSFFSRGDEVSEFF